jgi:flagellin-like protein
MKSLRRIRRDKKGINTILAALLMVVIVVVAAVMVYAWSTGLLSSLLVQNPVPKETLNYDSFAYGPTSNITIYIRNSGSATVNLQTYYVKDNSGNQYTSPSPGWTFGPIQPNGVNATLIKIGPLCSPACTYSGSGGGFTFVNGNSYTITVVTTRNNQFTWTLIK